VEASSNAKASTATTAKAGCCTAPPATRNRKPACAYLDKLYAQGLTDNDYRWLSPEQLAQQIRIAKPYGGIYAPHVATIHPAKLVRGLARTVENMGVKIYENSPVTHWQSGSLRTARASAQPLGGAGRGRLFGHAAAAGRYQLPVQSLIVATEPLSAATWDEIGLSRGQAFSESSRQVTYGQRRPTTAWSSAPAAATSSPASCATTST
jgi:glycine/D-amino acid oxidase-like deaminating enzyme